MSLASDLQILATQGLYYATRKEALIELPHLAHDLLLGATRKPKDPNFVYADLHVHLRDSVKMSDVLEEAAKRVDVMSVVERNPEHNKHHLVLRRAVEKLDEEGIEHTRLGRHVVRVDVNEQPFYIVAGFESYVRENQGVVMLGVDCNDRHEEKSLDETINACKEQGGIYFLDHPFCIGAPVISFRYPTEDEIKEKLRWFERYNPIVETANHQASLWMFAANVLARKIANEQGLPQIANSDTHFRVKEIGLSRTAIARSTFDASSQEDLIGSLYRAFYGSTKPQLESGYSSLWSFGSYMVLPTLLEKVGFSSIRGRE